MKARLDKDTLITSPEEAQEDFAPAGGIERIVAEIDEDEAESLWEAVAVEEEETPEAAEETSDDVDVDLEPGKDESLDPMRLYLREMSSVPLLTREDEIRIAKRIERGNKRISKALSRSFITIEEISLHVMAEFEWIIKAHDKLVKLSAKMEAEPKSSKKLKRLRRQYAHNLIELSKRVRGFSFTAETRRRFME